MKVSKVLIQYEYPGTKGKEQRPVGNVYVTGPLVSPQSGIFSHTYDPARATEWDEEVALREMSYRHWPNARIVPREDAPQLREP
jgi:hypothetical protein